MLMLQCYNHKIRDKVQAFGWSKKDKHMIKINLRLGDADTDDDDHMITDKVQAYR